MKSYAIYDEELNRATAIGYMLYYEKAKGFIIELCRDLDEWDATLLFQGLGRKGIYTIPHAISLMWINERIIPSGRQNIGSILKNHNLQDYSEMALLNLSKGRCAQDCCYIVEVSWHDIPKDIRDRSRSNVLECFPTQDGQLVCMFKDNTVRKVDLKEIKDRYKDIGYVLQNRKLLDSVKVGIGGYSIVFNNSIEVAVTDLQEAGELLPLTADDFYSFIRRNVVDATGVCDMMQCSRQNLAYMVKEGKIAPIISGTKANLYTRGAIERVMSE